MSTETQSVKPASPISKLRHVFRAAPTVVDIGKMREPELRSYMTRRKIPYDDSMTVPVLRQQAQQDRMLRMSVSKVVPSVVRNMDTDQLRRYFDRKKIAYSDDMSANALRLRLNAEKMRRGGLNERTVNMLTTREMEEYLLLRKQPLGDADVMRRRIHALRERDEANRVLKQVLLICLFIAVFAGILLLVLYSRTITEECPAPEGTFSHVADANGNLPPDAPDAQRVYSSATHSCYDTCVCPNGETCDQATLKCFPNAYYGYHRHYATSSLDYRNLFIWYMTPRVYGGPFIGPAPNVMRRKVSILKTGRGRGGSGGGGACFTGDAKVVLDNGSVCKCISEIALGDRIADGGKVVGVLKHESSIMYVLDGITVSGDHPVFHDGRWMRVAECDAAAAKNDMAHTVYNLITTAHRIRVRGDERTWLFTDYDEIDDTEDKLQRNLDVLNGV